MRQLIIGLIFWLFISSTSFSQTSIVGSYKLISFETNIDGEVKATFGNAPRGHIVITATRFAAVLTAETRKFGPSIEDRAALWDTVIAYTGPYRIEGDKLITSVEESWNESWNGKEQVRRWELLQNRLILTTMPAPYSRDPSKIVTGRLVFERVD